MSEEALIEDTKVEKPKKGKRSTGDKKEKLSQAIGNKEEKIPVKRVRRTKAQLKNEKIQEEQSMLRDDNFEIFQQIIKMLSDRDSSKYDLEETNVKEFEPLAKQYAMICNYYLPGGKPIFFVIASATFSTIAMMSERKRKIDESIERKPPTDTSRPPASSGKVRVGEESLNQEQLNIKTI